MEVFITNVGSVDDVYELVKTTLFCNVSADVGGSGTLTALEVTNDPDGDGIPGPSDSGIPFLGGVGAVYAPECNTAVVDPYGMVLAPGESRYLMTVIYEVSDCPGGEFQVALKCSATTPCGETENMSFTYIRNDGETLPFNAEHALLTVSQTATACNDGQPCTVNDLCGNAVCAGTYQVSYYGDIVVQPGDDGVPDITDVLCVLDGFRNAADCANGDIAPCGGDGAIDVGDVLAILDGFQGIFPCPDPCPPP
jgi:hypothetical protein